jgi:hypothetical protein
VAAVLPPWVAIGQRKVKCVLPVGRQNGVSFRFILRLRSIINRQLKLTQRCNSSFSLLHLHLHPQFVGILARHVISAIPFVRHAVIHLNFPLTTLVSPYPLAGLIISHTMSLPSAVVAGTSTVLTEDKGLATRAETEFPAGSVCIQENGVMLDHPNMYTIQLSETEHVEVDGHTRFLAHSCEPNSRISINGTNVRLLALRDIAKGELLTFDYCTTEWDMAAKFTCQCGAKGCRGNVNGFLHLLLTAPEEARKLGPQLSTFIAAKSAEWLKRGAVAPVAALAVQSA